MKIIEAGFSKSTHPGIGNECSELVQRILRRVVHIAWMNADARVDPWNFCQSEVLREIFQRSGEGDQAGNTRFIRTGDDCGNLISGEAVGSKVAMGIREHEDQRLRAVRNAATF